MFFPTVCIIYYALKKNRYRNPFLLIASYYFYMNWKPIYALLILTSTVITYLCGLWVENYHNNQRRKKGILAISVILNFAILFLFKYYNFINESIFSVLSHLGIGWHVPNLNILLPVGISFYTFQAVGYSIDVYRGSIKAERNFLTYALFVSYFPLLVAGPIERAKNLLPQFHEEHRLSYSNVSEGIKKMVWGFFMKLCVADTLGQYVDAVYNNVGHHNGATLILATFFFTFQIYCDFAGYSNIAIGAAKVMGFNAMQNFSLPYFSMSIKEFWRRWHISLSTWFADYLYIPLGGNRVPYGRHLLNLMITFLVSGIWHGANWTFVLWGALHGIYLVIGNVFRKYIYSPKNSLWWSKMLSTSFCFILVAFAWLFFRANTVQDAFLIINKMFTDWNTIFIDKSIFLYGFTSLFILLVKETKDQFGLHFNFLHSQHVAIRYISMVTIIAYIILFGALSGGQFIYFQF